MKFCGLAYVHSADGPEPVQAPTKRNCAAVSTATLALRKFELLDASICFETCCAASQHSREAHQRAVSCLAIDYLQTFPCMQFPSKHATFIRTTRCHNGATLQNQHAQDAVSSWRILAKKVQPELSSRQAAPCPALSQSWRHRVEPRSGRAGSLHSAQRPIVHDSNCNTAQPYPSEDATTSRESKSRPQRSDLCMVSSCAADCTPL
jgi:hypothetical protein